ncbi:nitroreductase/quinone reductase family protein [Microlunatus soli]|uniref:Deazaflavin-dependent oxidoreductase, nitroreductase family n=1 Tax=Microlunatus soli TaxID=630515 RepID=A0A1H1M7H3_9ACTN|nr:nitroreductase/quinone reductase family protein [Microlunatus soli]SDR82718.1 deazaflavin-dependent oxidoreductase, nitroreductase family [Microlunatus soli]
MNQQSTARRPIRKRAGDLFRSTARYVDDRIVKSGMRSLLRAGLAPTAFAMVETTGRRSGLPRQTPVGNGLVDGTFWLIAARGRSADYVRNLIQQPAVRIKIGRRWYRGLATVQPDDDPERRLADILAHHGWLRRFDARALRSSIRLLNSEPIVVRIALEDAPATAGSERSH